MAAMTQRQLAEEIARVFNQEGANSATKEALHEVLSAQRNKGLEAAVDVWLQHAKRNGWAQ